MVGLGDTIGKMDFYFLKCFHRHYFSFWLKLLSLLHPQLPRSYSYSLYCPPLYPCVHAFSFYFLTHSYFEHCKLSTHTSIGYIGLQVGTLLNPCLYSPEHHTEGPSMPADSMREVFTCNLIWTRLGGLEGKRAEPGWALGQPKVSRILGKTSPGALSSALLSTLSPHVLGKWDGKQGVTRLSLAITWRSN